MSRSYSPLPPSASMACSGTALPFTFNTILSYSHPEISQFVTHCHLSGAGEPRNLSTETNEIRTVQCLHLKKRLSNQDGHVLNWLCDDSRYRPIR
jgi:hypothetical protein